MVPSVATPLPLRVPVPIVVAPLVKVTIPPGVPAVEVTVAVSVTFVPKAALPGALNVVVVDAAGHRQ